MRYKIYYSCFSHIGKVRRVNQDNFICNNQYLNLTDPPMEAPLYGIKKSSENAVFGIFDGMGGEECGEVAAYLASKAASAIDLGRNPAYALAQFCYSANDDICAYAESNGISSMGTTAAMLAFAKNEIILCNIGDSKVFRFCNGVAEQISKDHTSISAYGTKPPLYQSLGIPTDEMIIDPYLARGEYHDGDLFLICSDGLTDMVSLPEITRVLCTTSMKDSIKVLFEKALAKGGRDNITIILCKIQRQSDSILDRLCFRKRKGE